MRHGIVTAFAVAAVAASVSSTGAAMARTRMAHVAARHHHVGGADPLVQQGRTPAYAPPAPIGVGLFGTGLFYGYGFPDLGTLF